MKPMVWLERFLLVIGIVLLAVYSTVRVDGWVQSRAALRSFEQQKLDGQSGQATLPELSSNAISDFRLWSRTRMRLYPISRSMATQPPLAVLRIPKIGLQVPVAEGTDEVTLNWAVGRVAGTAKPDEPGNIGIAGHRDSFFRALKDVALGDVLELETLSKRATYVVDDIEIVEPDDTDIFAPRGRPAITLVTCYPFYFIGSAPQRYAVHALLVQSVPAKSAGVQSPKPSGTKFNTQEKTQ